jgi:hypothetical protein
LISRFTVPFHRFDIILGDDLSVVIHEAQSDLTVDVTFLGGHEAILPNSLPIFFIDIIAALNGLRRWLGCNGIGRRGLASFAGGHE